MNHKQETSSNGPNRILAVLLALLIAVLVGGGFFYLRLEHRNRIQAIENELAALEAAEEAKRRQQERWRMQEESNRAESEKYPIRTLAWNVESVKTTRM